MLSVNINNYFSVANEFFKSESNNYSFNMVMRVGLFYSITSL